MNCHKVHNPPCQSLAVHREMKRLDAEERNALTPPERRRGNRLRMREQPSPEPTGATPPSASRSQRRRKRRPTGLKVSAAAAAMVAEFGQYEAPSGN